MERFRIIEVNDNNYENYVVEDTFGKRRNIGFQLYDIDTPPQVGDYIKLSKKYFDKVANEGVTFFRFGGLSEIYGRDVSNVDLDKSDEIIIVEQGGNKTYLKRFYG